MSGDIGNPVAPGAVPDEAARLAGMLGFVHPLVRHGVCEGLFETERLTGHARAARLLSVGGKAAERVAAHLLRVVPVADSFVVTYPATSS